MQAHQRKETQAKTQNYKVWGLLREHRVYLEYKGYIQEQESGIPNDESP